MIAFMLSNNECRRSWLLSFESRNPGEDIEENRWSNLDETDALRFSRWAAMLLITAINAGYMAVSFP